MDPRPEGARAAFSPTRSREARLPRGPARLWQRTSRQGGQNCESCCKHQSPGREGRRVPTPTSPASLDRWDQKELKADAGKLRAPGRSADVHCGQGMGAVGHKCPLSAVRGLSRPSGLVTGNETGFPDTTTGPHALGSVGAPDGR